MEDSEGKRRKWQAAACSLQCFARYIVNGSADHLLISFCLLFVCFHRRTNHQYRIGGWGGFEGGRGTQNGSSASSGTLLYIFTPRKIKPNTSDFHNSVEAKQ